MKTLAELLKHRLLLDEQISAHVSSHLCIRPTSGTKMGLCKLIQQQHTHKVPVKALL
mgnify:CR=1 FL=1